VAGGKAVTKDSGRGTPKGPVVRNPVCRGGRSKVGNVAKKLPGYVFEVGGGQRRWHMCLSVGSEGVLNEHERDGAIAEGKKQKGSASGMVGKGG